MSPVYKIGKKMLKQIILIIMLVELSGCGRISIHSYKAHDKDGLSESNISILHVTRNNYVHEIDGKGKYSPSHVSDLFPYSGAKIELLPGTHTLSMKYRSQSSYSTGKANLKYKFLPGKQYFLHSSFEYKATKSDGFKTLILYHIHQCGTKQEQIYNEAESKKDYWLNPFVPACGITEK